MANQDFMRFSLGVYTREQTQAVLDKILSWNRAGLPSQFAVVIQTGGKLIGYCGFFHQAVDEKNEIEIGYRLHPDYWNQGLITEAAGAVRDHADLDVIVRARIAHLVAHADNFDQPFEREIFALDWSQDFVGRSERVGHEDA